MDSYTKELGVGTYGRVMLNSAGDAVKIIENFTDHIPTTSTLTEIIIGDVVPENTFLIKNKGHVVLKDDTLIVYPLAEMDLEQYISKYILSQESAKRFLYQVAIAIATLHNQGIIHMDIKDSNVLIFRDKNNKTYAVLADYGLSAWYCSMNSDMRIIKGVYSAPEIRFGEISPKADVWSYGVLITRLFTSKYIFFDGVSYDYNNVFSMIYKLGYPRRRMDIATLTDNKMPLELNEMVADIFTAPEKRPSIFDILQNPYFDTVRETILLERLCSNINSLGTHVYSDSLTRWRSSEQRLVVVDELIRFTKVNEFTTMMEILDRYISEEWFSNLTDYVSACYFFVCLLLNSRRVDITNINPDIIKSFIEITGLKFQPYVFVDHHLVDRPMNSITAVIQAIISTVKNPHYPKWTHEQKVEAYQKANISSQ